MCKVNYTTGTPISYTIDYSNDTITTGDGTSVTTVDGTSFTNPYITTNLQGLNYSTVATSGNIHDMLDMYNYKIQYLEGENQKLRNDLKSLQNLVEMILNRVNDMDYRLDKDATIVKLSNEDKMFKGILGDMLDEEDDKT